MGTEKELWNEGIPREGSERSENIKSKDSKRKTYLGLSQEKSRSRDITDLWQPSVHSDVAF